MKADHSRNRGDVDDPSAVTENLGPQLRAVENTVEIGLQHALPFAGRHLLDAAIAENAGVVDENVQSAAGVGNAFHQPGDGIILADVGFTYWATTFCGVVATLRRLVAALRAAWPDVLILVRGDSGLAVPEMYEFCEAHGLLYALGYSSNDVRKQRTAAALSDLECSYQFYRHREVEVQRFEVIEDYQDCIAQIFYLLRQSRQGERRRTSHRPR
jgi:hypothetical protein